MEKFVTDLMFLFLFKNLANSLNSIYGLDKALEAVLLE